MIRIIVLVCVLYFGYNFIYQYYYFPNYKDKYDIGYDMYLDGDVELPYVYRPYSASDNEYKKNIGIYVNMDTVKIDPTPFIENKQKYINISAEFTRVTANYDDDLEAVSNEEITERLNIRVTEKNGLLDFGVPNEDSKLDKFTFGMGTSIGHNDHDVQYDMARNLGSFLRLKDWNKIRRYLK